MARIPVGIRRAIERFEQAAKEIAFIGSQPPVDHSAIEEEMRQARQNLEQRIMFYVKQRNTP